MYAARCKILSNKLVDLKETTRKLAGEREAAQLVVSHLRSQEDALVARMAALELELQLVRKELSTQRAKSEEVEQSEANAVKNATLIEQTLAPLTRDRDKARLLLKNYAPLVQVDVDEDG